MYLFVGLGLAMAFVGNWVITQPYDVWGWLETITPPAAVLGVALIGERVIISSIRQRHANERAYQKAANEWRAANADPERAAAWRQAYANALRAKIADVNTAGGPGVTKRTEIVSRLNRHEWRALVLREFAAENWLDSDVHQDENDRPTTASLDTESSETLTSAGKTNGHAPTEWAAVASMPPTLNGNGHTGNG